MAARKDKNKVNDELIECSAAANKRSRTEAVDGITRFLSIHFLHQQHERINTDLQLSPQPGIHHQDDIISSLMPQHNSLISYHINQMLMSLEEFWRRNFVEEEKQRKEVETNLRQKEEDVCRSRENYFSYEEEALRLEEMLDGVGQGDLEEEVESRFVDPNSAQRRMDTECRNCHRRPATMLWLPCRHVCVCLVCERRVKQCPNCGSFKTESFFVDLSGKSEGAHL